MNLPKIEEIKAVKDEEIPAILAGLSALQGALAARLMNGKPHSSDKKPENLDDIPTLTLENCPSLKFANT